MKEHSNSRTQDLIGRAIDDGLVEMPMRNYLTLITILSDYEDHVSGKEIMSADDIKLASEYTKKLVEEGRVMAKEQTVTFIDKMNAEKGGLVA